MGFFDGKLGWDDALVFPSLVTDAAVSGGKKLAGVLGAGGGDDKIKPNFGRAEYAPDNQPQTEVDKRYLSGMGSGAAQQEMGVGVLGSAADQAAGYAGRGRQIGNFGADATRISLDRSVQSRRSQEEALGLQRQAAMGNAPSQAELLLRAQSDDVARQNMALAASSRGGSQAAAMRNAATANSQMQLQAGQQAAALRAAEMAQARGAFAAGATGIRQQDLGSAQIGAGVLGMGLGAEGQGIGLQNQAGSAIGQLGSTREQGYLGAFHGSRLAELQANVELERQRMAAEAAIRSGNQAMMGGMFSGAGAVIGQVYGGPAGGAAGSAAGRRVGGG